jgi:hypothetical protein
VRSNRLLMCFTHSSCFARSLLCFVVAAVLFVCLFLCSVAVVVVVVVVVVANRLLEERVDMLARMRAFSDTYTDGM